jgi:hypothetical protein
LHQSMYVYGYTHNLMYILIRNNSQDNVKTGIKLYI